MKELILLSLIVIFSLNSQSQVVRSSCETSPKITASYADDADRLIVRRIRRNNLPSMDDPYIPQGPADTLLRALIAVYNVALPARDTVYYIHTFPSYPSLNAIQIEADQNLPWMKKLRRGEFMVGTSSLTEDLINLGFYLDLYHHSKYISIDLAYIKSDSNYNLYPLVERIDQLKETSARDDGRFMYTFDIYDSIYEDYVELTYMKAWGDCLAGCIYRRYWKFKVFFDCSVEFFSSFGNNLKEPFTWEGGLGIPTLADRIKVYPNPVKDHLIIEGLPPKFNYVVFDSQGKKVLSGQSIINDRIYLSGLTKGIYTFLIQNNNEVATYRVAKTH